MPLQRQSPVFRLWIAHDLHESMHAQLVIATPEHVEVRHKDDLSVLYLAFASCRIILLETISQESGCQFQNGVAISLQYLVASAS